MPLCLARAHRLDRRLRTREQREHVDLEHLPPTFRIALEDRSRVRHARVVPHPADPPGTLPPATPRGLNLARPAKTARDADGAPPRLGCRGDRFVNCRLAAARDIDGGALAGEVNGDRAA